MAAELKLVYPNDTLANVFMLSGILETYANPDSVILVNNW
jgi:hypothetical protein